MAIVKTMIVTGPCSVYCPDYNEVYKMLEAIEADYRTDKEIYKNVVVVDCEAINTDKIDDYTWWKIQYRNPSFPKWYQFKEDKITSLVKEELKRWLQYHAYVNKGDKNDHLKVSGKKVYVKNCFVDAEKDSVIIDLGGNKIYASQNAEIESFEYSEIWLKNESSCELYGGGVVVCRDRTRCNSYEDGTVITRDFSEATIFNTTRCHAVEKSKVSGHDNSFIMAFDDCSVDLYDDAMCKLWGCSKCSARNNSIVKIPEFAKVNVENVVINGNAILINNYGKYIKAKLDVRK